MDPRLASSLRELRKLFVKYVAVGGAFIPSGLLFGFLVLSGWGYWWVAAILLAIGFLPAYFVWTILERRFPAEAAGMVIIHKSPWLQRSTGSVLESQPGKSTWYSHQKPWRPTAA